MKALYEAIIAELGAVKALKYVDVYNGQLDQYRDGETFAFPWPCAFVEIVVQGVNALGGMYDEQYDLEVNIHIGHEYYHGDTLGRNLEVFDITQAVYKVLKRFCPDGASTFTRTGEVQDFNHTNIYHFTQTYATTWIDISAEPETIERVVPYSITPSIHESEDDMNS
jgi:hypothetical protein